MPQDIYNANGNLQLSDYTVSMGLLSNGSLQMVDDGQTHPQPMCVASITVTGTNPIFSFKPPVGRRVSVHRISASGNSFTFYLRSQSAQAFTLEYWVFDIASNALKDPTLSNGGIQLFDANGVLTYDAAMSNGRAITYLSASQPTPPSNFRATPNYYHSTVSYTVPAGKTYAIAPSLYGFTATMYDTGGYSNTPGGGPIIRPDDPSDPSPGQYQWKSMRLETYETTGSYSSENVINVGQTRFELFNGWYPFSTAETAEVYGNIGFVIIDVTNFVSSGTVQPGQINVPLNTYSVSTNGAPNANIVSASVTASPSGGTGGYTYEWQYVDGSTIPVANGSTTTSSLQMRSNNHPGGVEYTTRWQCKVTSGNGLVGYSDAVTFTFTADAIDVIPDPVDWPNISASTNDATISTSTASRTITGINQSVRLRATISNLSGNYSSGNLQARVNGTLVGDSSGVGNGYWAQATVTNGQQVQWTAVAGTTSGIRTISYTVTVTNVETGGVVDTFTVNQTVDADNNYNTVDVTPDVINPNNLGGTTNSNVLYSSTAFTVTGINQQITLRVWTGFYSGNLDVADTVVYRRPNASSAWEQVARLNSKVGTPIIDFTVSNGWQVQVLSDAQTYSGRKTGEWRYHVENRSDNNFYMATRTISVVVDDDNNYNTEDYDPDTLTLQNINVSSNDPSVTGGADSNLVGFNQNITLRVERYYYSGNLDNVTVNVYRGPTAGQWGPWTFMGGFSPKNSGLQYIDVPVSPNQRLHYTVAASTNGGRQTGSWEMWVHNLTRSTTIGTATVNVVVDNDNNYNLPIYTANPMSFGNLSTYPTENWLSTSYNTNTQTLTGPNRACTMRVYFRYTYVYIRAKQQWGDGQPDNYIQSSSSGQLYVYVNGAYRGLVNHNSITGSGSDGATGYGTFDFTMNPGDTVYFSLMHNDPLRQGDGYGGTLSHVAGDILVSNVSSGQTLATISHNNLGYGMDMPRPIGPGDPGDPGGPIIWT